MHIQVLSWIDNLMKIPFQELESCFLGVFFVFVFFNFTKIHSYWFKRRQYSIGSRNGFAANRRQGITWSNDGLFLWHHMVSFIHNKLRWSLLLGINTISLQFTILICLNSLWNFVNCILPLHNDAKFSYIMVGRGFVVANEVFHHNDGRIWNPGNG